MLHVRWIVPIAILSIGVRLEAQQAPKAIAVQVPVAPTIDGRLDDGAWAGAAVLTDFVQREPMEGRPVSERTEVRVVYDGGALYVGAWMYDADPSSLVVGQTLRDASVNDSDAFLMVIDTYLDRQNGFVFGTTPAGIEYDGQISNEGQGGGRGGGGRQQRGSGGGFNLNWDGSWQVATSTDELGWYAEMRIPFSTLRYGEGGEQTWGLNFERNIRRNNEQSVWAPIPRQFNLYRVSMAGTLDLRAPTKRVVTVSPYMLADGFKDYTVAAPDADFGTRIGGDAKVGINQSLTLDLTVNTDFAQVEVDDQQVNLTRFSLFFPEQREFFLEGRENFSFGTPQGRGGGGGGPPLALLFFSRSIGLGSDGTPVPLDVAAKLTGKIGRTRIGILNAQTGDTDDLASDNFTVVRLQQEIFARSRIGMLMTNRTGGGTFNRVAGADGDFTFYKHLNVRGFVARATDTYIDEPAWAGQGAVSWNSDRWNFSGDVLRISPDFRTDVGFILRRDIVRQAYRAGWSPRPRTDWIRQIRITGNFEQISDTSGSLQSREQGMFVNFSLESGDSFFVNFDDTFERLEEPFRIHRDEVNPERDVTIPVGDYDFQEVTAGFNLFRGRSLSGRFSVGRGGFFSGDRTTVRLSPSLRIGQRIQTSGSYTYNRIDLEQGKFSTHLVNGRLSYSFNDRWLTDTLIQYSNTSDMLTLFVRLDYIYRPNDDLFLVYQQTAALGGLFDGEKDHQFVAKLTRSFEF